MPRAEWRVNGHTVTLDSGFEPGTTYEISYRAANPPVAGLGFVAVRDTTAWLKHQPDALAPVRYAYGYGSSQSGRFLRGFLYEGFNTDEHDRQVFDGVMAHIAGASRLSLNERWAKPTGLGVYNATAFPFADASLRDPVSGAQDGLLDNARIGGARAEGVLHQHAGGVLGHRPRRRARPHRARTAKRDLPLPDNVRVYFIAGTQHSPSRFPAEVSNGQQPDNPVDYWWTMRALLLAMHKWVKEARRHRRAAYPRLQDDTLVPARLDRVSGDSRRRVAADVDGGRADREPVSARHGRSGNGRCRCWCRRSTKTATSGPASACPTSPCRSRTYTGWNFRKPAIGAPNELVSLLGSSILVSRDACRARGGSGSAPLDRGALSIAGGLPGESGAGRRRAGEGRLPARGRRAADSAARRRSSTRPGAITARSPAAKR